MKLLLIGAALSGIYLLFLGGVFALMHMPNPVAGKGLALVGAPAFMVLPMESMWCRARRGRLEVGQEAPDFDLPTRDGASRVRLSALRGSRPVVLAFGSYTCPPFRSEMPAVGRVYEDYRERALFYFVYIEEAHDGAEQTTFSALFGALGTEARGRVPGVRAIFMAALLLQVTFQSFASWYVLHGTERFGGQPEDMSAGFIAWAMGGVVGALPAGFIGVRLGRRNAMLAGLALMAASFIVLDRVTTVGAATALLALASAAWTLPAVNAYPLFIEPMPAERRGDTGRLVRLVPRPRRRG